MEATVQSRNDNSYLPNPYAGPLRRTPNGYYTSRPLPQSPISGRTDSRGGMRLSSRYSSRSDFNIEFGDKIHIRLQLGNRLLTFVFDRVADMTDLIGEIRYATRHLSGLASLYVRNVNRGWSVQRPLMLYPSAYPAVGV